MEKHFRSTYVCDEIFAILFTNTLVPGVRFFFVAVALRSGVLLIRNKFQYGLPLLCALLFATHEIRKDFPHLAKSRKLITPAPLAAHYPSPSKWETPYEFEQCVSILLWSFVARIKRNFMGRLWRRRRRRRPAHRRKGTEFRYSEVPVRRFDWWVSVRNHIGQ